jgi:hypothetical protein
MAQSCSKTPAAHTAGASRDSFAGLSLFPSNPQTFGAQFPLIARHIGCGVLPVPECAAMTAAAAMAVAP